jgi:hypothetical protein
MTYRTILALLREWVETQDQYFDAWGPRWGLASKVDGAYNNHGNLQSGYCAQVMRALNALTDEGVLVKRTGNGRDPHFWTAEAYARHEQNMEQAAEKHQAQKERWDTAYARLAEEGFTGQVSGFSVTFGVETVECLADRLRRSRHLPQ